jgi:hypothetical protein
LENFFSSAEKIKKFLPKTIILLPLLGMSGQLSFDKFKFKILSFGKKNQLVKKVSIKSHFWIKVSIKSHF